MITSWLCYSGYGSQMYPVCKLLKLAITVPGIVMNFNTLGRQNQYFSVKDYFLPLVFLEIVHHQQVLLRNYPLISTIPVIPDQKRHHPWNISILTFCLFCCNSWGNEAFSGTKCFYYTNKMFLFFSFPFINVVTTKSWNLPYPP